MRILKKKHPEFALPKETYCLFEKKTETYIKNEEEKIYQRTTCIKKSDKVSSIVQHRKHVENIATVLPKIRE